MKISHTSKTMYNSCAYQYFLHYMRKLRPVEENSSLFFGSCIDKGINHLLLSKNLDESISLFNDAWDKAKTLNNIKYSKSDLDEHLVQDIETKSTKEASWESLKQKGTIILTEYNAQILPRIKNVLSVQIDELVENECGDKLNIKPDLICEWEDGKILLVDNKTSTVKYDANSVKESEQLSTYFDALKERYNLTHCAYFVIPKKPRKLKKPVIDIEVIIDTIPESKIESTYGEYQHALDGIKAGQFPKNMESCIAKYGKCVYYDYCRNGSMKGLTEKE